MATGTEILVLAGTVSSALFIFAANRGLRMRDDKRPLAELLWYVSGLIPLAGVCLFWAWIGDQPVTPQRIMLFVLGAAIGGLGLLAAGELIRPTQAQNNPPQSPGAIIQKNQNAPNFNVPGSGNQFNIYPPGQPQQPRNSEDVIHQGGITVGQVYGGRRSPTDATMFEFQEITQAQQFNLYGAEFEYQGHVLRMVRVDIDMQSTSSRSQDGRIITRMTAKVIR